MKLGLSSTQALFCLQEIFLHNLLLFTLWGGGKTEKQAGAELCQAQVKLEVIVEVEFGVEVEFVTTSPMHGRFWGRGAKAPPGRRKYD